MPALFWLDVVALITSAVGATALALMALGAGLWQSLNRRFAVFTLTEAIWAAATLLLRLSLWLEHGNPQRTVEVVCLVFSLMGPLLFLFAACYTDCDSRWLDLTGVMGLAVIALLTVPLFQHRLVFDPQLAPNGTTVLSLSRGGLVAASLPALYMAGSLVLFWRARRRTGDSYLAWVVLILLLGFIVGGVANIPFPVVSITNTISVALLGYGVISRQVFNPLRERTAELQREIAERKRIEQALRVSESNYRNLVERANDGIVIVQDDLIRYANPRLAELSGLPLDQIVGELFTRFVAPESLALMTDRYRRRMAGEQVPRVYEATLLNADGQRVYVELNAGLIVYQDRPADMVIVRDVTERRRVQQEIRQRTAQLEALREVGLQIAGELDTDVLIESIVLGAVRLLRGVWGGMFLYRPDRDLIEWAVAVGENPIPTGHVFRRGEGIAGKVWETGEPSVVADYRQQELFPGDAEMYSIGAVASAPVRWAGKFLGVLQVMSDTPDALSPSDAEFLSLFAVQAAVAIENARLFTEQERRAHKLGILLEIVTAINSTLEFNQVLEELTRRAAQACSAQRCTILLLDDRGETLQPIMSQFASGQKNQMMWEHFRDASYPQRIDAVPEASRVVRERQPLYLPDAHVSSLPRRWIDSFDVGSLLIVPMISRDQVVGVMGFDRPGRGSLFTPEQVGLAMMIAGQASVAIENARLYQQERRNAKELLQALIREQEVDHLKSEFVQNVSHELRSPLALIRGYAELLISGELGELAPLQRQPVETIARRSRMLSDLVEDITLILLAESRIPESESVALGELAQAAVDDFRVAASEAQLMLDLVVEPGLPLVSGGAAYMRRVLDNLLGNAIKFTPAGGAVTVRVGRDGDTVMLQVIDSGIGIPPQQQERIFERFYQVDGSTRRRYGGVGLGLALVEEIVQALGGRVRVDSAEGQGSTFTVTLPAASPAGRA